MNDCQHTRNDDYDSDLFSVLESSENGEQDDENINQQPTISENNHDEEAALPPLEHEEKSHFWRHFVASPYYRGLVKLVWNEDDI